MTPRYQSMPWAYEAVGTAEWTGTPLRHLLDRAGLLDDVVEISFIGADRGFDRGHEHAYGRSLTREVALGDDILVVWAMNGQPLLPQHGYPLRLDRARLVRHGEREMARRASRRWPSPTTASSRSAPTCTAPCPAARPRR